MESDLPLVTPAQLALRNGQDKPQIWIAYRGIVYDATPSALWREGKHYEHWAGQDLTSELPDAPHTEEVFARLNVIGQIGYNTKPEKQLTKKLNGIPRFGRSLKS